LSYFEPSRAKAESLRLGMERSLWSSATELLGVAEQPKNAIGRASFLDFGAYADLGMDIPDWQERSEQCRAEAESHLLDRLNAVHGPASNGGGDHPPLRNMSGANFTPIQLDRMDRWFVTEESNALDLCAAAEQNVATARANFDRALDVLKMADSELYGETVTIVDTVVAVGTGPGRLIDFTSLSSFALWGAIAVSVDRMHEWTYAYDAIVHESGHNVLFAIAREGPLVRNTNDEVHSSPIRDDPRPVDGIYHAAFVTARESLAFDRLLAWDDRTGGMSGEDRKIAETSLETSVINFWQSVEALREHADFTELGRRVLDECEDYMTANFALEFE